MMKSQHKYSKDRNPALSFITITERMETLKKVP